MQVGGGQSGHRVRARVGELCNPRHPGGERVGLEGHGRGVVDADGEEGVGVGLDLGAAPGALGWW